LPLLDASFDCVAAAWMLYHVADLDGALGEAARVLRPKGRFVAVTNSRTHLRELAAALGVERPEYGFSAENGAEALARHFDRVERLSIEGSIAFPSRDAAQAYVDSSILWRGRSLPPFDGSFRVRRASAVFVATKT
jgi:SAM-dependent methyltransferase